LRLFWAFEPNHSQFLSFEINQKKDTLKKCPANFTSAGQSKAQNKYTHPNFELFRSFNAINRIFFSSFSLKRYRGQKLRQPCPGNFTSAGQIRDHSLQYLTFLNFELFWAFLNATIPNFELWYFKRRKSICKRCPAPARFTPTKIQDSFPPTFISRKGV